VHPSAQRVADALARAGARGGVRELDDSTRTAADAAAALGCAVGAIANSLVFVADGEPVLVLTSGAHRVDTAHLAAAMGWSSLKRATADEVRAATGQPIGGVAPLGHPSPLRVLIDGDLRGFPTIWAAAGTPHSVFPTDFDELQRISAASAVRVEAPAAADGHAPA
jgi:prolyl-tRNA editing enzyme YbaK/EbsC (Cys-tRNA(Pro) deacylase)